MTLEMIAELVTGNVQTRVPVLLPFDGTWLAPTRSVWEQIAGENFQQLGPEFLPFLLGSRLGHRLRKLAHGIHTAFETDLVQGYLLLDRGLSHRATDQIVGDKSG